MAGNCSQLARDLMDIARFHVQNGASTIDEVVDKMSATIPDIDRDRLVSSILEVMESSKKAMSDFEKRLQKVKREAKSDKSLRTAIEQVENALRSQTLPNTTKRVVNRTGAIQDLLDTKNELMKQLAKSEPALKVKYEKSLKDAYKRLEDLSRGKIVPQVRQEDIDGHEELMSLRQERDAVQIEIRRAIEKLRPKTPWEKGIGWMNAVRSLVATGEFSGVLRQGKYALFIDPESGIKAVRDMLQTFADPKVAMRVNDMILTDPEALRWIRGGLHFSDINGPLAQQEENIMSPLAGKIPILGRFDIAYNTFMNSLRYNSMKALTGYAIDENPTMSEIKDLANAVNAFTGRGDLSLIGMESSTAALNATLFSPRYFMSRIQMLTMQPAWGAANANTRKIILSRMYGRSLLGMAALYSLYGVALGLDGDDEPSVGFSPLSSQFGKIKVGNVRIDPMAGLVQPVVFLSQAATGVKETLAGKREAIRGKEKPFAQKSIVSSFVRSKLAPGPGAIWDSIEGENVIGEPNTLGGQILGATTPMTYHDIYDVMTSEMNVPKKTAISILSFFGEGVQVYKERARKRPRR